MSRYRETLNRWAAQHIPEGSKVVAVDIDYDDGYDPTFTDGPASLSTTIRYEHPEVRPGDGYEVLEMTQLSSLGEMLTELFAIEEADDDSTA